MSITEGSLIIIRFKLTSKQGFQRAINEKKARNLFWSYDKFKYG